MPKEQEKQVESTKIEKIKSAAIKIISSQGYGNTSVAKIAEDAGVSVGYLYRHYDSKKDLISDIVSDMHKRVLETINSLLDKSDTVDDACEAIVDFHYNIYTREPEKMIFLVMLINDFGADTTKEQKEYLTNMCKSFHRLLMTKKGIREGLEPNEVYIALLTIPLQSYAYRLRGLMLNDSKEQDNKSLIKKIILRIVKK